MKRAVRCSCVQQDDGFQLWIDNHLLMQKTACIQSINVAQEFTAKKQLEAGPHHLELYYYNCEGDERRMTSVGRSCG